MKMYKIEFQLEDKSIDTTDTQELIELFLLSMKNNGNILSNYELAKKEHKYLAYACFAGKTAWNENSYSTFSIEYKKAIEQICKIDVVELGESVFSDSICDCNSTQKFILKANNECMSSPVVCGDCGHSVPLYLLAYIFNEKEHISVINWELSFNSVLEIWHNSINDKFSERQLISPISELSKRGRKICENYEIVNATPFYYFLFDADFNNKYKLKNKCPLCGNRWRNGVIGSESYLFCDTCRLTSKQTH